MKQVQSEHFIKRYSFFCLLLVLFLIFIGFYLQGIILPFCLGLFLAYILNPLVNYLSDKRKINRNLATLLVLCTIIGSLTFASVELFPVLYDQLFSVIHGAPKIVTEAGRSILTYILNWMKELGIKDSIGIEKAIRNFDVSGEVLGQMRNRAQDVLHASTSFANKLFSILLVPVVSFFCIADKRIFYEFFYKMTPPDLRAPLKRALTIADQTLQAVIRGHFKVAAIDAVLYSIGFSIVGLSSGIAIGLVAGFCRFIPYGDAIVGLSFGTMYVLLNEPTLAKIIGVISVVICVQVVDGTFITPRVIGGKVGLHAGLVILTVIASGHLFGFWGVILAIPIFAVLKRWFDAALPYYHQSKFYNDSNSKA